MGKRVVVVDVDGVVSAVHPEKPTWGDEVVAGTLFGPVLVSPTLCARLDVLADVRDVECVWLTSWGEAMRARMSPFPGRYWAAVADPEVETARPGSDWWKLTALERWLDQRRDVDAVAWCEDHLRGGRPAAVRRRFAERGADVLLIRPDTSVGLTPQHLDQLEAWSVGGR